MFYSVIETRDFSLFNQSAQALLKGYFIKSYRNTRESLGETRNCVGTRARSASVSTQFRVSPKLSQVFL